MYRSREEINPVPVKKNKPKGKKRKAGVLESDDDEEVVKTQQEIDLERTKRTEKQSRAAFDDPQARSDDDEEKHVEQQGI